MQHDDKMEACQALLAAHDRHAVNTPSAPSGGSGSSSRSRQKSKGKSKPKPSGGGGASNTSQQHQQPPRGQFPGAPWQAGYNP
jgi:hypothetical protein